MFGNLAFASIEALRSALSDAPEGVDHVAISNGAPTETTVEFYTTTDESTGAAELVFGRTYDFGGYATGEELV